MKGQGKHTVHPTAPEMGHCLRCRQHPTKRNDKRKQRRHQKARKHSIRTSRSHSLSKTHIINFKSHEHKPSIPSDRTSPGESNSPVPTIIVYCSEDQRPGDFHDECCKDKCYPVVDFGIIFAGREDVAQVYVAGLQLLDQRWGDGESYED